MKKLIINKGSPLTGSIIINGAKNAALPIMAASILIEEEIILHNIPYLLDVNTMNELLSNLGIKIQLSFNYENLASHTLKINASQIHNTVAPHHMVSRMRASCLVLGPLLARYKKAKVAFPGGCTIGPRPIDMHLQALQKMGAIINLNGNYVEAFVRGKLQGTDIVFPSISVGATENIIMAATLANGKTTIHNAAIEPEILDLINFLNKAGANIKIIGNREILIQGVSNLHSCTYKIIPDRLEAGTYALAAILTRGKLELIGISLSHINCIINHLKSTGAQIQETNSSVIISKDDSPIYPINIITNPYPSFPSDMQAQFAAILCLAKGQSIIEENVFEKRFMYVPELIKMGANIVVDNNKIIINGVDYLNASNIYATDLRANAALLVASLIAKGETIINNSFYLDRGYESIEKKLNNCGANIKLVEENILSNNLC